MQQNGEKRSYPFGKADGEPAQKQARFSENPMDYVSELTSKIHSNEKFAYNRFSADFIIKNIDLFPDPETILRALFLNRIFKRHCIIHLLITYHPTGLVSLLIQIFYILQYFAHLNHVILLLSRL